MITVFVLNITICKIISFFLLAHWQQESWAMSHESYSHLWTSANLKIISPNPLISLKPFNLMIIITYKSNIMHVTKLEEAQHILHLSKCSCNLQYAAEYRKSSHFIQSFTSKTFCWPKTEKFTLHGTPHVFCFKNTSYKNVSSILR